ncbi:MAG: cobyric acid synthase [Dehalococcoidia bacterium]|nr:cobyric acid synthase [Dehalococcoidia bacterium]
MVQGTASHVGKSVLVTALCRILRQDGFRVAPFKAQNMSNNSSVTPDGGEIGRAQAVQAEAAGVESSVEMNPILLKPEADNRSQVVLLGRPLRVAPAREYYAMKPRLWEAVTRSLDALRARYDVVVVEGAGSPAEVNLKEHDIVNMRVARYANAPVLLVADIDRGGVFASLIGTLDLLEPEERALVRGLVVNKFRGDPTLFASGVAFLEQRTGLPVAGVLPYFRDIPIPQEDSVALEARPAPTPAVLDVAVLRLPRIANFDDFDPIARHPGVALRYVESTDVFDNPDLVIIPGAKSTVADLAWLRETGLAEATLRLRQRGVAVIGVCGGYQMLGQRILDPLGVESPKRETAGLGLLDVATTFAASKETHRVQGRVLGGHGLLELATGAQFTGYEIHMGRTAGDRATSPFLLTQRSNAACEDADGAISSDGWVLGTYIHGLFHNRPFRAALLSALALRKGVRLPPPRDADNRDAEYDKLAAFVRAHLDMGLVYRALGVEVARVG